MEEVVVWGKVENNEEDLVRKKEKRLEERYIQRDVKGMVGLRAVGKILHVGRAGMEGSVRAKDSVCRLVPLVCLKGCLETL